MEHHRPITVGQIDYANAWPLFHYAINQLSADKYTFVKQVPSLLNQAMGLGQLDITAMAAFAYAEQAESYYLLPDVSISAKSDVNSILLFLKKPIEDVIHGTIAVTNTSATSIHLLKMMMQLYYNGDPHYVTMNPSLPDMLVNADAALLIGDPAIQASWRYSDVYTVIDLGRLWREWTGMGMTFAVVAVRRAFADANPQAVAEVWRAMLASRQRSAADCKPLIAKAMQELGGSEPYWSRYFKQLHHEFGPAEQAGLLKYFHYANQLGYLKKPVEMQFFYPHSEQ